MNQTAFDPLAFTTSDAGSTEYVVIPEGEYVAAIKRLGDKDGNILRITDKGNVILDVLWNIDDQEVLKQMDLKEYTIRQSIFLDMTEDGMGLDMGKGKNRQLWLLREAVGQNQAGKKWNMGMLLGSVAKIKVKHRIDDGNIYADVKGTAPV